ncbi:hypothetical protein GCM10020369_29350 [Cryptosporangium minutisporangium]|uniref:Uncharacterized protein n=1 Tax=Cryptosporangium minutisporangium TaxID=113569 RepID=A0ABP6SYC6_9ACTN
MVQPGGDPGLALEPLRRRERVTGLDEYLDRHRPIEVGVVGGVDGAGRPPTQHLTEDITVTEARFGTLRCHPTSPLPLGDRIGGRGERADAASAPVLSDFGQLAPPN